jgi:serine/threonine-protein kinase ULK/ATG1
MCFFLLRTYFLCGILKMKCSHLYLHMTGASSPLLSGPLAMLPPILDSPVRLSDNNNLQHSPVMPFGTRAMTLPEISGMSITRLSNRIYRV